MSRLLPVSHTEIEESELLTRREREKETLGSQDYKQVSGYVLYIQRFFPPFPRVARHF